VNNVLQGTATPSYDYMPQSIQPASAAGAPNFSYGANIGVAVIDSGIHVNQDLIGNGSASLLANLFPRAVTPRALSAGRVSTTIAGTAHTLRESSRAAAVILRELRINTTFTESRPERI
jgi:hypothetical protein